VKTERTRSLLPMDDDPDAPEAEAQTPPRSMKGWEVLGCKGVEAGDTVTLPGGYRVAWVIDLPRARGPQ